MDMGGHPEWERILDVGGDPGGKGMPAVGAGGSSKEGGGSEKKGPGLHRVTADTKDLGATPNIFFGGGHTGSVAESGLRPEPTPRAYRKERDTGQAPCYAVERTVSPVRIHSLVRYIPTPRIGRARVGIQPGRIVLAQRAWPPERLFGPGCLAPALCTVSPVRLHSRVRPVSAPRIYR